MLENSCITSNREQHIFIHNGELVTKEKVSTKINTIEKWTDAFIIFMSIYISAHPHKASELLKYMSTVRLGASRYPGLGFKTYDEQYRLRKSLDPASSWAVVDNELWLFYMVSSQPLTPSTSQSNTNYNKCYDFNFQGACIRNPCQYQHICLRCGGSHSMQSCGITKMPFRSNLQSFRPRFNSPHTANAAQRQPIQSRTTRQPATRYLGPRAISNQNFRA